jgi:hypothetical protein
MHSLHNIIMSNASVRYICSDRGQSAKLLEDVRYLAEAHGTHMDAGHQPNTNTNATSRPEEASDSTTHEHPSPDAGSSSSSESVWRPSLFPVGLGNGNDAASTDFSGLAKMEPKDIYCGECSDAFMHDPPRSSSAARRMKVRESDQVPLDFTLNFDTDKISSDSWNSRSNGTSNTSNSSSSSSGSSSYSSNSSSSSGRNDKGRDATSYSGTTGDRMKSKSMGCSRCGNCTEEADASGKAPFPSRDPLPQDPPSREQTDLAQVHLSRADRVMMNFRELLWYWREYYLRRGRDRLSIEFSSHIPFFQWSLLVGMSMSICTCTTHMSLFFVCYIFRCIKWDGMAFTYDAKIIIFHEMRQYYHNTLSRKSVKDFKHSFISFIAAFYVVI